MARQRSAERTEFLSDVLTTAIENYGYGWFAVEEYPKMENDADVYAVIIPDDEPDKRYRVTLDTIAHGFGGWEASDDGTPGRPEDLWIVPAGYPTPPSQDTPPWHPRVDDHPGRCRCDRCNVLARGEWTPRRIHTPYGWVPNPAATPAALV